MVTEMIIFLNFFYFSELLLFIVSGKQYVQFITVNLIITMKSRFKNKAFVN